MSLYKEYVTLGDRTIKFTISFSKDTWNHYTSQPKRIGYQVTAIPVTITKYDGYQVERSECFTGFNTCILEVGRQSAKRLQQAIGILQGRKEGLLEYFK